MWILLLGPAAMAAPDQPFPRAGERLRVRTYAEVRGDGPVRAHIRRRGGPVLAWTWPDGMVEHYERREDGLLTEARHYDAAGTLLSTVRFVDDKPASALIGTVDVDVSGWVTAQLGGATLRVPSDGSQWAGDGWLVTASLFAESADVFSDEVREALADQCGCVLLDRVTRWIDGVPAAKYRVLLPDVGEARHGEVWALPVDGGVLVLASTGQDDARLATGRAITALLDLP